MLVRESLSYHSKGDELVNLQLSGPGTQNLINNLSSLLVAAKEACEAYAQKAVKEMQAKDVELTELHRRRQRLESEVKTLEERKRKALIPPTRAEQQANHRPAAQNMRSGTKPLTPEQMAKAQYEAEEKAKAEAEAKRNAPLTHTIKGLEGITLSVTTDDAEQQA